MAEQLTGMKGGTLGTGTADAAGGSSGKRRSTDGLKRNSRRGSIGMQSAQGNSQSLADNIFTRMRDMQTEIAQQQTVVVDW